MEKQNKKDPINNLDEFEILDPNALDEVLGGVTCKQKYSSNELQQQEIDAEEKTSCGCGYRS